MRKSKPAGDCYYANGEKVLDIIGNHDENEYRLCHGVAILATDGLPFGHCWIEYGNNIVMDFSNGNNFIGKKELYYKAGGIPAKGWEKIYRYTPIELSVKLLKKKHWGPWDYNPPR